MVDRFERFTSALSEISRAWHKLASDEMEKIGLKATHSLYLTVLARHADGLTSPQLCELCVKDKSDVSRMMSILVDKGFAVKEGSNKNRYGGIFKLTDEGFSVATEVEGRTSRAVELAGSVLSDEQREEFYSCLEALTESMIRLSHEGIPE